MKVRAPHISQTRKIRYYIYLRDVLLLAVTAFGGPQAHIALFIDVLVRKRGYLNEKELIELNALCQILPGPTSTQTITAIGFRIGGPGLAYLTLLVWMLPAITIMTAAALALAYLQSQNIDLGFTKFIQPIAVGFVAVAAYRISSRVVTDNLGIVIMIVAAIISYFAPSPYVFPALLLVAGSITAFNYKAHSIEEKAPIKVKWHNFILWVAVFIGVAALGGITRALPIRLFENFYRNGSLIFGGGQVLIPLLYTEFVDFKGYLSSEEFLSGYAFVQSVPGPVFSFSAFVGTLSMRSWGVGGQILGGIVASLGIFLPGTFLIFFVARFWEQIKKYRIVRASLNGINAASSGMVIAAGLLLFRPLPSTPQNFAVIVATLALLLFTRIPAPYIIIAGLLAGFIF